MKLEEFQRFGKTTKKIISYFQRNSGKFAAIVLQMYWDMEAERDACLDDIKKLRERNKELEQEKQKQLELLRDISKFINYKLEIHQSSFIYKNYRAKLDKLG
ncbi:hypothetical protein ACWEWU_14745, partial [Staphylococcus xylosus]